MKPLDAAFVGSREMGFTIVSISVSLVAVFIPIFFMPGVIGLMFHEFAVVVTLAIAVSAAAALTIIPMLAARFIHHRPDEAAHIPAWSRLFERGFNAVLTGYSHSLAWTLHRRWLMLLVALATCVGTVWLYQIMPKGFFPEEDISQVRAPITAAQDISWPAMR